MAGKQTLTAWRTVTEDAVVTVVDEGDIFKPLRAIRDKYLAKAAKLEKQGHNALFYLRAAAAVTRLLGDTAETLTVEFTVAV